MTRGDQRERDRAKKQARLQKETKPKVCWCRTVFSPCRGFRWVVDLSSPKNALGFWWCEAWAFRPLSHNTANWRADAGTLPCEYLCVRQFVLYINDSLINDRVEWVGIMWRVLPIITQVKLLYLPVQWSVGSRQPWNNDRPWLAYLYFRGVVSWIRHGLLHGVGKGAFSLRKWWIYLVLRRVLYTCNVVMTKQLRISISAVGHKMWLFTLDTLTAKLNE